MGWHDFAISLGLAVGVLPQTNPEQGDQRDILALDSLEVIREVAAVVGCDLTPPQVGAMMGVRISDGGVVPIHALLHFYTAYRIGSILAAGSGHVIEIGGGVGLLAWYTRAMNVAVSHTIFDLPLVSAIQGYYLLRSPLNSEVRLFGESSPGGSVFLRPGFTFKDHAGPCDLVVNQDSLPEMGASTMNGYLDAIEARRTTHFLSINQESQNRGQGWVSQACRHRKGFDPVYRAPYWLRRGYVEELYRVIEV